MEGWIAYIQQHAPYAHWYIFGGALLAGLNIPIPIDLLMIISAVLAAAIIPAHLPHLFFAIYLGCIFSAWIAYWLGRLVGPKISTWPFFSKLLSPQRLSKMQNFYTRNGFLTLLIGRFIPFGVRNCLYLSSGMSRMPFTKFALYDFIACSVWSLTCFFAYYNLGKNIDALYDQVKVINLLIFLLFGVTVIAVIWYKKKKRADSKDV